MNYILKNRLTAALALFIIGIVPLSFLMISGCASKLSGEQFDNQAPTVGFINSPPESTNFSRNSVVYWWGTDVDGVIDYFRYHVVTVDDMGGQAPDQYIAGLTDSSEAWVIVDVDVVNSQPGTESIIKLSADLNDPVNRFVLQYIFLQAFDEEGLASTIVWRIFGRNDNPPQTLLFNPPLGDIPFVNAITPGGIISGVKMRWEGSDPIDYPSDPPPFDFHYRLYGPYDSTEYAQLENQFFQQRYLTATGLVFKIGDTIITCDTLITVSPDDTTISCDTLIISSSTPTTAFGGLQDYFAVDDTAFDNSKLVYQSRDPFDNTEDSVWVQRQADTIFNVYKNYVPSGPDTTVEMNFVFWVRSRDDALVPDLIPAYRTISVLNPRYERGVLVIDATNFNSGVRNWANAFFREDHPKSTWQNIVNTWANGDPAKMLDTNWIPGTPRQAADYFWLARGGWDIPLAWVLKHKVAILYKEGVSLPDLNLALPTLYKAIDAGVNVWVTMRANGGGGKNQPFGTVPKSISYARYFGVSAVIYTAWACHAAGNCPPQFRIEDFVDAYPKAGWPQIPVSRTRMRDLLRWAPTSDAVNYPYFGYDSVTAAYGQPEVGWSIRTFGTELLYRYKSYYGSNHPLGRGYDYIFEGAPVAIRLNAGLYRTVHCNFTPLTIDSAAALILGDSVLTWLYDPSLGTAPITDNRYEDSKIKMTVQDAQQHYRERLEYYEMMGEIIEPSMNK